jgi:putative SOS response-associated peptidase YedK
VVAGEDGTRRAAAIRWGLLPSWADGKGRPLINARDDKLAANATWRSLASSAAGRCLVLADGWVEWQRAEDPRQPRQPFLHRLPGAEPFAFAGLWCTARPKGSGDEVASCAIVTTTPCREAARLHDRMPAILDGMGAEAAWLDRSVGLDGALELLGPVRDGLVDVAPVSPRLNRAGVEGADLLVADPGSPQRLF